MINSMRGCVAFDDLWPWPISSLMLKGFWPAAPADTWGDENSWACSMPQAAHTRDIHTANPWRFLTSQVSDRPVPWQDGHSTTAISLLSCWRYISTHWVPPVMNKTNFKLLVIVFVYISMASCTKKKELHCYLTEVTDIDLQDCTLCHLCKHWPCMACMLDTLIHIYHSILANHWFMIWLDWWTASRHIMNQCQWKKVNFHRSNCVESKIKLSCYIHYTGPVQRHHSNIMLHW